MEQGIKPIFLIHLKGVVACFIERELKVLLNLNQGTWWHVRGESFHDYLKKAHEFGEIPKI
jgi:hypothetical protein